MPNKEIKYKYRGVNQDLSKSLHPFEYYYEASHIRLLATNSQSTGSVTNEKGNEKIITIPAINIDTVSNTINYNNKSLSYINGNELDFQIANGKMNSISVSQKIINITSTRTGIVIFTTDDNGMDCIWSVENLIDNDYNLELLYVRNLGFSTKYPIQGLFNYENDNIQKVYWVDGKEQIRFINLKNDSIEGNDKLINTPLSSINFVGTVNFSQPQIIDVVTGGNHTSGMIQYAYNLFRKNSSQTKISPLSELIPLDKGLNNGGGDVGEIVGSTPVVSISNIDNAYTNIKIYAIKYTSFNQIPSISLIDEREISSSTITIYDDGNIIESLTLEEFIFLGSDPIIPKHIQAKDNRLFPANIKTQSFKLPDSIDFRAYSFELNSSTTLVYDNIGPQQSFYSIDNTFSLPKKVDSVNINLDDKKYQFNSNILGGEGKYLKYEIVQKSLNNVENYRLLKDNEIYRIAIELYNNLGQVSSSKWIADFKTPSGNLEGNYNTLKVELKSEFYTWLNSFEFESENDRPVGYRILRAERNASDKTILAQGIITPMMFQVLGDEVTNNNQFSSRLIRENFQDSQLKIPNFLVREFQGIPNNSASSDALVNGRLQPTNHLNWMNDNEGSIGEGGEIFTTIPSEKASQTFQYTKMMQLYFPEIIFQNNTSFSSGLKLRVLGLAKSTLNGVYAQERFIETQLVNHSGKALGGLNPWFIPNNTYLENNQFNRVYEVPERGDTNFNHAFIGPSGSDSTMNFKQYYRAFNTFISNNNNLEYNIYGTPEITPRGDDPKFYNGNAKYNYSNSLQSFISDGDNACNECDPLNSINSFNIDNLTLMLGDATTDTSDRKGIEDLYNESSLIDRNGVLLVEVIKDTNNIFTSNIYGGNSYEDKKRNNYVKIGSYKNINDSSVQIDSPGDTFVQKFKFLRINKTDNEVYDTSQTQLSEIVEYFTETTIDLKNRNDLSLSEWDTRFQPRYDEYNKYNTVYSQQSNLIRNTDEEFTFDEVKNFDTRIQSTKLKVSNELIDSWTDILPNETMDLNGRFGPINNLVEYNDTLFAFQDEAIANLSINPRIQISSQDGVGLELGTGGILNDYNYITTKSGSINKWGIISTKDGIYYYDALNKGIGRIPDLSKKLLSDVKGLHSFFNNNYVYNSIKKDNPILREGVLFSYDNYNNDVYFTIHQGDKSFTWCYNEGINEFVDLKTYLPTTSIYKGEKLLLSNNNNEIYESNIGEYNKFFGEYQPSYITLQLNPESDMDTVFNNIRYNSEVYLNDIDQPLETLTHIHAFNEYQDSGRIPLIVGRDKNLRRKFREWKALIPRDGRNRIRNTWIYLKLEFNNTSNFKLILHDIIIGYNI